MVKEEPTSEGIQVAEYKALRDKAFSEWIKESELGDKLKEFYTSGQYDILNREVLEPLEREAFNTIKNPEFDPSNQSQVYQLRALCQSIDLIRQRIQNTISNGVAAKIKISEYNTTQKEGV